MEKIELEDVEFDEWVLMEHYGEKVSLSKEQEDGKYKRIKAYKENGGFKFVLIRDCSGDLEDDGEVIMSETELTVHEVIEKIRKTVKEE